MEFIRVAEMLAVMEMKDEGEYPIPFGMRFDTIEGKRITCSQGILVGGMVSNSTARNPNHYANFTRNVRFVDSQEIRKFRPLLVEEFNGLKVIL
jgi:hypothetical protein